MKFISTLLAQIADKKDAKDVEREVQKADLDLLAKINEIAGGSILSLNQKGYTEKPNDGYAMIDVTTGGTTQIITLARASQVATRVRTYAKNDNGAGELLLACQGQDVIQSGGTATAVYVGLQNQSVTLLAVTGGYRIVAGVTQTVAGEPSIGTWHDIASPSGSTIYSGNPAAFTTITFTGCPVGTKKIKCFLYGLRSTATTATIQYRPTGSGAAVNNSRVLVKLTGVATGMTGGGQVELPVNSAFQVDITADGGDTVTVYDAFAYC
jgi:hypothetical protein